jgi:hypothetical protein
MTTEPTSLDELFSKRSVPTVIPAQKIESMTHGKKPHGSVKANIIEAFTGRELTVNEGIERMKVKDPKLSEGSVRSRIAQMRKQGELVMVRKEGREPVLTMGSGSGHAPKPQEPPKVATASGGLAADIAALQSALATLRNIEPVIQRVLVRLTKLSEVL